MVRFASNRLAARQGGFTLTEVLVALMIISVGLLAMASMSLTVIRTNLQNDIRNAAIRVASDLAEDIYARPFGSVVDGFETRTVTFKGAGSKAYDLVWDVEDQTNDLKQVTITVHYSVPGSGDQTNTTVIYRHRAS